MSGQDTFTFDGSLSRRVTAVELVRDTIRTAIMRGDLRGGSRLVQTEIADQLKVSTTPVREAMRDLANEGLITMDSYRIGTVRSPAWEEMVEIVAMRRALESVAIERAMLHVTEDDLKRAALLADELAEEKDLGSWVQKNSEFHSIFHRATRTNRLSAVLVTLEQASGVFVAQAQRLNSEIRSRAVTEHYQLLEAYEEGVVERALDIQLAHLNLPLEVFGTETHP